MSSTLLPTLYCHVLGAAACGVLPPTVMGLTAHGWGLQALSEALAPEDGASLVLLWCLDCTDLEQAWASKAVQGRPVLLVSPPLSERDRQAALQAGVLAWLPLEAATEALHHGLQWLHGLNAHQQAQRQAQLSAAEAKLDDRKWTDRAKGLLMQARGIDEPTAFALLRDTAMQTQTRLPAVARGVVQTSELAEALERAGAQRMLSQRLVKLQALRQWSRLAPAERREAQALQDASAERVSANLERLAELLRGDLVPELAAVAAAWRSLDGELARRPPDLARSDAAAHGLREASETLVAGLSARASERPVALLAKVTRLRLLSQSLAKEGLLLQLDPGRDATGMATGLDEFIKAYDEVRATPLVGPAVQPALAAVDEAWLLLLRGLRAPQGDAVQRMHQGSERLLQALEALTQALQTSLQLILG